MSVKGICATEFNEIKNIFQSYFDKKIEEGANFSIIKNGTPLINIYGGSKNDHEDWDENTIVNTFSLSKGIYAACVAKLINENKLNVNEDISFYWPEFRKNIKVKYLLSHQSGLHRFKTKLENKDLLNFSKISKILESQNPDYASGEKTFYHAKTHGYLVENLIRKITSQTLKEYFKENFRDKLICRILKK